MPRIVSMARSRPTRSSVVRCADTAASAVLGRHLTCSLSSCAPGSRRAPVLGARPGSPARSRARVVERWSGTMEREWVTRLRWRMRGAWLWPSLRRADARRRRPAQHLPLAGDGPGHRRRRVADRRLREPLRRRGRSRRSPARRIRRRRPDLPKPIAENYAGTALVGAIAAALARRRARAPAGGRRRARRRGRARRARTSTSRTRRRPSTAPARRARPNAPEGRRLPLVRPGVRSAALAVPVRAAPTSARRASSAIPTRCRTPSTSGTEASASPLDGCTMVYGAAGSDPEHGA